MGLPAPLILPNDPFLAEDKLSKVSAAAHLGLNVSKDVVGGAEHGVAKALKGL
jgi:hypothetical protein